MGEEPAALEPARTPGRRPSRRAVLAGLAGVAAAAVGVPVAVRLTHERRGRLVPELLTAAPFYVAHRGGSADWPEMSMSAYRNAVEAGVDALEISLARSADGVWFGLHDATLDRTAGTTGMVASEHSWAEISTLRIKPPAAGQEPQPYVRFEEVAAAFGDTHAIFVDPKAVHESHYGELVALMAGAVRRPQDAFVAKYYCTGQGWAALARAHGYRTWGYYYGREIDDDTTPLAATEQRWDLLGLDVRASPAAWRAVLALGRPVVAHVVSDAAGADRALAAGAHGLMVSGVREVLPRR